MALGLIDRIDLVYGVLCFQTLCEKIQKLAPLFALEISHNDKV